MMIATAIALYVLFFGIWGVFFMCARGTTLDELFARDLALHNRVHAAIERHPKGGPWDTFRGSIAEEAPVRPADNAAGTTPDPSTRS